MSLLSASVEILNKLFRITYALVEIIPDSVCHCIVRTIVLVSLLFLRAGARPVVNLHLESECPSKDDAQEDVVLSEKEARTKDLLAIHFMLCHLPLPSSERAGGRGVTCL